MGAAACRWFHIRLMAIFNVYRGLLKVRCGRITSCKKIHFYYFKSIISNYCASYVGCSKRASIRY